MLPSMPEEAAFSQPLGQPTNQSAQEQHLAPLPMDAACDEAIAKLMEHKSLILTAAPGTGKSTRLAPALLRYYMKRGINKPVVLLVPRRVIARSLVRRIAYEQGWKIGEEIGWQVRHEKRGGKNTRLWIMTAGTLFQKIDDLEYIESLGAVFLDEFHERALEHDALICCLREYQRSLYPELSLLILSATLDAEPLKKYLNAPHVHVEGEQHQLRCLYRPTQNRERLAEHVVRVCREACEQQEGDILVFLPGKGEIKIAQELLSQDYPDFSILTLHGSLSLDEQERAIQIPQDKIRRIILATNIAESALTVPGIRIVVDSGQHRIDYFDYKTGIDELRLERISADAAVQRAGRAAREADGVAYRCFSEQQFKNMPAQRSPALERSDLSSLALRLKHVLQPDLDNVAWFVHPPQEALAEALSLLRDLQLIEGKDAPLNEKGEAVQKLPLHPRFASLLLKRDEPGIDAVLVALLQEQDIRPQRGEWVARGFDDIDDRLSLLAATLNKQKLGRDEIHQYAARELLQVINQLARQLNLDPKLLISLICQGHYDSSVQQRIIQIFPDRLAQRSAPGSNRVRLSTGAVLHIDERSTAFAKPSDKCGMFVLALNALALKSRGQSKIVCSMAIPLDEERLRDWYPEQFHEVDILRFDPQKLTIVEERQLVFNTRCLRVLSSRQCKEINSETIALLQQELLPHAEDFFLKKKEVQSLMMRLIYFEKCEQTYSRVEHCREALKLLCHDYAQLAQLKEGALSQSLQNAVPYDIWQRFEELVPESVQMPNGHYKKLEYTDEHGAVLRARLQECIGWDEGPRLGDGTFIVLELLAPNQRPVQITSDLSNFWRGSYQQVRKDLRGRYPKHPWPEDPLSKEAFEEVRKRYQKRKK